MVWSGHRRFLVDALRDLNGWFQRTLPSAKKAVQALNAWADETVQTDGRPQFASSAVSGPRPSRDNAGAEVGTPAGVPQRSAAWVTRRPMLQFIFRLLLGGRSGGTHLEVNVPST
jgi:hypothetical protein